MSNQGHICIAITKSNMGGAQKYVFTLAKQLRNEGKKVTVLAGGDGLLITQLQELGITVIKLKNSVRDISIFRELKFLRELYSILKEIKPDVLHLNSSKMGVIGSFIGRIVGIKRVIFTAHGWAFNEDRPQYQKAFFYLMYLFVITLSHKTICVSKKTAEQISVLPFIKNKLSIIYNGIEKPNLLELHSAKNILVEKFPQLDPTKTWIGVPAELHPIKGHDILIDALAQIIPLIKDTYQIIFMGSGQIELDLKKVVSQKSLEEYVFFTGFLENASQYFKAFETIILPSRSEAMPLCLLEAGLAKNIIIASNVGGISEIISDGETGFLFEKENVGELIENLKVVFSISDERKIEITEVLHHHILSTFSLKNMIIETKSVYNLN